MKTTVVNLRKEKYDVYIGRGSIFGNPYRMYREDMREEVISKYALYFYNRIKTDENFYHEVCKLKGKILGCFCKPLNCHGDVITDYINKGNNE